MKRIALIGLTGLIAGSALAETTTIRNGSSTATITQSDGPTGAVRRVDGWFGSGRVEQQSGGSSAKIVQEPAAPVDPAKQDTLTIRNGNNSATITQSGDPANSYRRVERWDGHTRIEQRNGSNSSVIVQDGPNSPSPLDDDPFFKDDD